jgi:hypothetical protein
MRPSLGRAGLELPSLRPTSHTWRSQRVRVQVSDAMLRQCGVLLHEPLAEEEETEKEKNGVARV